MEMAKELIKIIELEEVEKRVSMEQMEEALDELYDMGLKFFAKIDDIKTVRRKEKMMYLFFIKIIFLYN